MESITIAIKAGIATAGGMIIYWLGGLDKLLIALLVVIVLDYLTGVLKAIHNKELSSDIGYKGIAKKVFYLVLVALSFVVEDLTTQSLPLREIVIMFFIANEGLSIIENAAQTGLPIPPKLKEILGQLKGNGENDE